MITIGLYMVMAKDAQEKKPVKVNNYDNKIKNFLGFKFPNDGVV